MCGGHANSDKDPSNTERESSSSSSPSLPEEEIPRSDEKEDGGKGEQEQESCCYLLELAANNDLPNFQKCVEQKHAKIDGVGTWYARQNGSKQMVLEQRTPAMIAALYGSLEVLKYIVKSYLTYGGDINQVCGNDNTTALHCGVAGGSASAVEVVKLLLDSGADASIVDTMGRTPADVIDLSYRPGNMKRLAMEELVAGRKSNGGVGSDFSDDYENCFLQEPCDAVYGECSSITSSSSSSPKSPQLASSKNGNEKTREYPVDPSLPDIKNSIYTTDEFRMYTFKVRPCSRAYSHDWTECPFVHPGENARRRDPRRYHYSCVPCPDFRKGACRRGDSCEYAHGVFECWLHPAQYRTRLCKDGTDCNRRVCFFAHTPEELRPLYVSTGSAVPSPRSSSTCLDMPLMSPPRTPGSPLMRPSFSPSFPLQGCHGSQAMSPQSTSGNSLSLSQSSNVPTLHLPGSATLQTSRLRTALSARDVQLNDSNLFHDFDGDLLGEFPSLNIQSLSTQARLNAAAANGKNQSSSKYRNSGLISSNLDEMFPPESVCCSPKSLGHDSSLLEQLEAHHHMQLPIQFQSHMSSPQASAQMQLQAQQQQAVLEAQLQGGFLHSPKKSLLSSPFSLGPLSRMSPLKGMDFEKQQQQEKHEASLRSSLAQHEKISHNHKLTHNHIYSQSSRELIDSSLLWSDWGSPTGKPEWGIQGEDLSKLRRSASSGLRPSNRERPLNVDAIDGILHLDADNRDTNASIGLERENADMPLASWIDKLHIDHIVA